MSNKQEKESDNGSRKPVKASKKASKKKTIKKAVLEQQIKTLEAEKRNIEDFKFLESLIRHITLVRESALLLAKRIWERAGEGDQEFSKKLLQNVGEHDRTKFFGIEWDHLRQGNGDQDKLKVSYNQHVISNPHHPEHWGGLNSMPLVFLAEMVCDWKARSDERGSDLRDWIKNVALDKYEIPIQGKAYKSIKEFVDLLLEPLFSKIGE